MVVTLLRSWCDSAWWIYLRKHDMTVATIYPQRSSQAFETVRKVRLELHQAQNLFEMSTFTRLTTLRDDRFRRMSSIPRVAKWRTSLQTLSERARRLIWVITMHHDYWILLKRRRGEFGRISLWDLSSGLPELSTHRQRN